MSEQATHSDDTNKLTDQKQFLNEIEQGIRIANQIGRAHV